MRSDNAFKPEDASPPAFWTPPAEADIETLKRQTAGRRFDAGIVHAIAARCRHGFPQVIVCRPLTESGTPFPTVFWLTCPWLDKKCGTLESLQKIAELEKLFNANLPEIVEWHKAYSRLRISLMGEETAERLKSEKPALWDSLCSTGVGGIAWRENPAAVKCLHLQTATMLGGGGHPLFGWLLTEIGCLSCDHALCGKAK